jgi:hypothetical protein
MMTARVRGRRQGRWRGSRIAKNADVMIARRIVELAKEGERDPLQVRERTLKTIWDE